jgi:hypothetical protein
VGAQGVFVYSRADAAGYDMRVWRTDPAGSIKGGVFKMNYWLLCLPREDMERCMRVGTFGLARKHILGNVVNGDPVVCCAGKGDWKIIGIGAATSDYYVDDTKVFLKDGYFPDRFDFKAEMLQKSGELGVMSIIDQLSFVKDLAYWAVFFRNGIVKMSKQDWELICKESNTSVVSRK